MRKSARPSGLCRCKSYICWCRPDGSVWLGANRWIIFRMKSARNSNQNYKYSWLRSWRTSCGAGESYTRFIRTARERSHRHRFILGFRLFRSIQRNGMEALPFYVLSGGRSAHYKLPNKYRECSITSLPSFLAALRSFGSCIHSIEWLWSYKIFDSYTEVMGAQWQWHWHAGMLANV